MAVTVVCISRTMGAGGEDVGRLVASSLGFDYVDEDIVSDAAQRGGVSPEDVADAERRQSFLRRWLAELGPGAAVESYGIAPASAGVLATMPSVTGTSCLAKSSFAWYSIRSTGSTRPSRCRSCRGAQPPDDGAP